jgi:hypothetical protein
MSSKQESPTEAFIRDVSTWKLAGVIVWHAGLFMLGAAVWSLPLSTSLSTLAAALFSSSWFYLILVYLSMTGVLYAQRRVLTTIDVPPLYVAKLGWSSKAWPTLLLSRWVLLQVHLLRSSELCCLLAPTAVRVLLGVQRREPKPLADAEHPPCPAVACLLCPQPAALVTPALPSLCVTPPQVCAAPAHPVQCAGRWPAVCLLPGVCCCGPAAAATTGQPQSR